MIPGSALRKLEAQTGLKASKSAESCYRLDVGHSVSLFSFLKDEKAACKELREMNWRRVCHIVSIKQEYKCAECKKITGLSGHHVLFRSRWRRSDGHLDVESNVRMLCVSCHKQEHR